ncbi:MAG: prophage endopeptidase tail family protein [Staphylococcus warneri]|uniref:prophage endopeptidase tail family protein n=1 Tax=Staphylococcus warneri TaxID=1292 RepID=UPI0009A49DDF|nr:prophage endopeptidase tail family protein [Staphylococcus warneri]MCM3482244.1 phage tail protein [Staphylococcus warneri]MCT1632254.1 phage tail protein [Staphylococcus warneri]MCT2348269.1 phage tail protein [Staphylococcus warneri]MCV7476657.1 phage tail protein [Staphylococcus warneri]MDK8516448.1 prophage endopeptidase tail family protein [Staphylococcus warneri]
MKELVVENKAGNYAEILTDYDYDTFKYEYEKNNERSISLTAYKSSGNEDIFDMLVNENYIIENGQYYVIKSTSLKYDSQMVLNDVIAKHIFMDFQNHYVDKDISKETLNDSQVDETNAPQYILDSYLSFGFKDNNLGFSYEIVGDFSQTAPVSELGGQNGIEFIVAGAELFNYIYFADNKKIYFYTPDTFYKRCQIPIIYRANSDELQCDIVTTDLKTYIKGYGKKKTVEETKNYQPKKPKDFKLSGSFKKEGTWYSETKEASFSIKFNCKWGNETLTWTNKQLSLGGVVDVYLDEKKVGTYSQYSKRSKTNQITIKKGLEKGSHSFKVVFKGGKSGVDYKKKTPRLLIGTEKTNVLNLTAELKGEDIYHVVDEYKAPTFDTFGMMQAPTVFDDNATTKTQIRKSMMEQLNDSPTVELATNYLGTDDDRYYITSDDIAENNVVRFVHKPLQFNSDLKVVKITRYHSKANKPVEVEFSNAKQDIISIQNQINLRIKRANSKIANGSWTTDKNMKYDFMSNVVGSVLVDE